MATYFSKFRTNYFWVRDDAAFLDWISTLPGVEAHRQDPSATDGPFMLVGPEGQPSFDVNDEEIHFSTDLAPHLMDDQIAIIIDIGSEKLCYLSGEAVAIHSSGRSIAISLNDIYAQATETFGTSVTRAEY